jgi:hypothetical protein
MCCAPGAGEYDDELKAAEAYTVAMFWKKAKEAEVPNVTENGETPVPVATAQTC